jgi:hypothetical protein
MFYDFWTIDQNEKDSINPNSLEMVIMSEKTETGSLGQE